MIKGIMISIMAIVFSICHAQNKHEKDQIKNLYKHVQFKNQAVEYRANIQIGASNFELLINDVPVEQYFGDADGTVNTSIPINDAILHSGSQRWKLILYHGTSKGKDLTGLSSNVLIDIEIEKLTPDISSNEQSASIKILATPTVLISGKPQYKDAGKVIAIYEGINSIRTDSFKNNIVLQQ
ncbi:hypothetical protein [Taibaiella koreensis]|uniref:hypothetical protein n=1 Tax=Taibaiella koreensis TaxID=1268548 RepID=UPI0013C3725C|nr:hypothetical protein [Taibaiella koreensis]